MDSAPTAAIHVFVRRLAPAALQPISHATPVICPSRETIKTTRSGSARNRRSDTTSILSTPSRWRLTLQSRDVLSGGGLGGLRWRRNAAWPRGADAGRGRYLHRAFRQLFYA